MDAYYNLFKRTADGIKPGLEVIYEILKELDYPQTNMLLFMSLELMVKVLFAK